MQTPIKKPLVVGLTGGIGSGKTTISIFLKLLNVPIYNADIEAKKLYNDISFQKKLKENFGKKIFNKHGIPDKQKIAELVFNNPQALQHLNSLIHPTVKTNFENWTNTYVGKTNYVIQENAIIFESGFDTLFSKIICIYTPVELAIQRVIKRDNVSEQQVLNRINNQMDIEEKKNKSDFIIYSTDKELVLPQVLKIHDLINKLMQ